MFLKIITCLFKIDELKETKKGFTFEELLDSAMGKKLNILPQSAKMFIEGFYV